MRRDHSNRGTDEGLHLRQKTMWNGFDYDFAEPSGRVVGGMKFANFAQAKNARLAFHPPGSSGGDVKLAIHGQDLLLRFEYLRRGFRLNDLRYTLETPAHEVLCSADIIFEPKRRLPAVRLTEPMRAEIMPSATILRRRFPVISESGAKIGEVYEPRVFTLRFEYGLRMAEASPPLQAFVLALTFLARR